MNCRQYYKVNKCITKKSNNKCSFLYSGSNNNTRAKNTRANIYNITPNTVPEKELCQLKKKKRLYLQNTGSQFSLLKKKYNLTRETKENFYNPKKINNEIKENKKIYKRYKKHGKPLPNPSLGSSSALSRAIQRRIAKKDNLIN
tara:strand:- start:1374 stop:1805 length:432 start_codon:yes stop_codon:yes gene_type:complete